MKRGFTDYATPPSFLLNMKTAVIFREGSQMNAGFTLYLPINGTYSSSSNWLNNDPSDPANTNQGFATLFPFAGTLKNFYIWFDVDNNPGETTDVTIMLNGVATSVVLSVPATGIGSPVLVSDTVHSFTVAAGDLASMRAVLSASASGGGFTMAYEFDPT
jgi:hypothetical protein